ncbi:MAG: hypothetical protein HYV40_06465 [Candidatus Levybacteria bacterium]|nr:hypothetical protein [Candidatus Levybacteria bacterium]
MVHQEGERIDHKRAAVRSFAREVTSLPRKRWDLPPFSGYRVTIDPDLNVANMALALEIISREERIFEWSVLVNGYCVQGGSEDPLSVNYFLIEDSVRKLFGVLDGNDVEVNCRHWQDLHGEPIALEDWSTWEGWKERTRYLDEIHRDVVSELYPRFPQAGSVLDIFGGDGSFLSFIQEIAGDQSALTYFLADGNPTQCVQAADNPGIHIFPPVDLTKREERVMVLESVADLRIVTAIGGLCRKVVREREAIEIAEDVYNFLPEGGLFVVSGLTPTYLNSGIAEDIGFTVLNKSLPQNLLEKRPPFQLYVLRK